MILFLAFVLPPLTYYVLARRAVVGPGSGLLSRPGVSAVIVFAMAVNSASAVYGIVTGASRWKDRTEIAWTAIQTPDDNGKLVVGGARESAVVGWPNGAFWPRLEATPSGLGKARVEVRGGGGAVETKDGAINGHAIGSGESRSAGPFTVSYRKTLFARLLTVSKGKELLATLRLRPNASRVVTLAPLVAARTAELRAKRDKVASALALELEDWAADVRILIVDRKTIRLLDSSDREATRPGAFAEVTLPAVVTVRWPDITIPVEIARGPRGGLVATFLPPWRMACPTPPPTDPKTSGDTVLTITGEARPGDRAFELPLGRGVADPHLALKIRQSKEGPYVLEGKALPKAPEDLRGSAVPGMTLVEETRRFSPNGMTSAVGVPLGTSILHIATIRDLPDPARLRWILGIGLAMMAVGLWRCGMSRSRDQITLNGLVAVAWSFAALRLLLAFRYAIDPTGLDRTAVKGLGTAAAALVLLPGFVLLVTSVYRDGFTVWEGRTGVRRFYERLLLLSALCAAAFIASALVPGIWPNLPERLVPEMSWFLLGVAAFLAGLVTLQLLHTYVLSDATRERFGWLSPLSFVQRLAMKWGPNLWGIADDAWPRLTPKLAVIGLALIAPLVLFAILNRVLSNRFFQEVASPFLVAGLPAIVWLSAKARWGPDGEETPPAHAKVLAFSLVLLWLPILSPLVIGDVGGVFATLAFFVPLSGLLLATSPRRFGGFGLAACALIVVLGTLLMVATVQVFPGIAASALERGVARYLVFRRGPEAQKLLPFARISSELGEGVTERSLQNTIEHSWENTSIAHWGKTFGMGFAQAPTRRSMVPLVPIQSDSTFSFYVVSEHGLVGGAGLMLLYAVPLLLILQSARRRLDVGHLLGAAIAASFLNEALVHASMNLGALPFTGRNLPLLSVNSNTELLRWVILFGLLGQAVLWRRTATEDLFSPAGASVLSAGDASPEPRGPFRLVALSGTLFSAAIAIFLYAIPAARVARDTELGRAFTWNGLLGWVESRVEEGQLVWDAATRSIRIVGMPVVLRGESFLEQEIERFNSLPADERVRMPAGVGERLAGVRSLAAYDEAMNEMRLDASHARERRTPLFRVVTESVADGTEDDDSPDVERLAANPDFNVELSFGPDTDPANMPSTTYRGGRVILGPAWVNGRWRASVERAEPLPWAGFLAGALRDEWRLDPQLARKRYPALTLDSELEDAAMRFTAEKGRELFARRLVDGRLGGLRRALPPRVALAIVDLPGGEVRALGGWPRMTSSTRWRRAPGGEWIPSAAWLEKDAPDAISNRYFLDRNFDRIEMGSASKPIWAAAVLDGHPGVDEALRTRGPEAERVTGVGKQRESESEVFGIPIAGRSWHATLSREWIDFARYLSRSDNRYQVRLGFVGLAESSGEKVRADAAAGASPSDQESLERRGASPWRKYPKFPEEIRFSAAHPKAMAGLEKTALARSLLAMFSIGLTQRPHDLGSHRRSFWTLHEEDDAVSTSLLGAALPQGSAGDVAARARRRISGRFLGISPETVRFGLDGVTRPRDYVSRLVGGSDNRWSNVDFAAAFATSVSGHPVLAHVVPGATTSGSWRKHFPETAIRLRPGLAGVLAPGGTAYQRFQETRALAFLASLPGVKAYAKTGTITLDRGRTETSRLTLALVKWKDESKGEIASGLVFSLMVEKAEMGMASAWLGEFLVREGDRLRREIR